jgi:electron transfer flavoprotein beta subunit
MRILVPIKQVPETSDVEMDPETGTMVRSGVVSIVNPLDLYAIEVALQLREEHGGSILVVSMGPPKAESAVREAISMGCDDGLVLTDRAFAGADTWATAYVLAAAARAKGPFDLIICGERATDGDTGQVGPALASFLDLPVLTYVASVEAEGDEFVVRRLVENGYEVYRAEAPLLLTVVKEIAYPRLPTLRGKQRARRLIVEAWDNERLGLDPADVGLKGSPTRVKRIFRPKVSREGERIVLRDEEDVEAAVARVMDYLERENLL